MKKLVCIFIIFMLLSGCSNSSDKIEVMPIDTSTVYSLLDDDNVYILDVREESEYESGHLRNSYNMPLSTIENIDTSIISFDSKIIVYCQSGVRSRRAADMLVDMGYINVYNMGGINNWDYELVSE